MSKTGFFAGLAEEVGTSSLGSDVIPQSMRFPKVTNPTGIAIVQAPQQHGSGSEAHRHHAGFPPPSGFSGPSPERRIAR